jgi:hypothetical protein
MTVIIEATKLHLSQSSPGREGEWRPIAFFYGEESGMQGALAVVMLLVSGHAEPKSSPFHLSRVQSEESGERKPGNEVVSS